MSSIIDFGNLIWFDKTKINTLCNKYSAKIVGTTIFNNTIIFICETRNSKLPTLFSYIIDTDTFLFNDTAIYYKNNTIQSLKHSRTLVKYKNYVLLVTCRKITYWDYTDSIVDNNNLIYYKLINNTKSLDYQKVMNNIILAINNIFSNDKHIRYLSIDGISIDEITNTIFIGIGVVNYSKTKKSRTEVILVKSKINIINNVIEIDENFDVIDYINLNIVAIGKSLPKQRLSDIHFDKTNETLYVLTHNITKGYLWKYKWYKSINMFNTTPTLVSSLHSDPLVFNQIPSSITKLKDNHFLITLNHKGNALNINNFDYVIVKD
jgi:hypothetical protein